MFPIRDDIPTRIRPLVTWAIILANGAVFAIELALGPERLSVFLEQFGLVPARFTGSADVIASPVGAVGTLFTSMFLHGGLLHILLNMWTFWIFGNNVEDRMGHARFLVFYLLCGLASAIVHTLFQSASVIPTVGASGAIAGVLGAYFLMYPRARVVVLIPILIIPYFTQLPAFLYLGIWFVLQILSGAVSMTNAAIAEGIAWWAHVGGFGAGMLLHRLFLVRNRQEERLELENAWGRGAFRRR